MTKVNYTDGVSAVMAMLVMTESTLSSLDTGNPLAEYTLEWIK